MLAVPFSLVGAVWLLWLLGYHLSGAVWVGMIALAGLDAETGLVMLLYLDNSYERFKAHGKDEWRAGPSCTLSMMARSNASAPRR